MKIYKIMLIALLAVFIGACNTATEQKKDEGNSDTNKTTTEKTDETTPADDKKDKTTSANSDTPTDKNDKTTSANSDTPTDTLKTFVEALKAEDEAAIKNTLSEKTVKMLDLVATITQKSFYQSLTAKDKDQELKEFPETQNEKIDGDKATIEVKGKSDKKWITIPFVKEAGTWKIAFFDDQYDKEYEILKKEMEGKQPNK